jgi:ATP-dependent RNA helicase DeaD
VEQVYYEVDRRFKVELLTRLIDLHDLQLGIIFCNTKRMVDDLVDHLNAQGYSADRLHGDMSQAMRDRVMNKFRRSGLEFLVATDVAARGIDVENVQVVFNYDLPYDAEDYLHRIGRTGRAGRSGRAISFASGREVFQIQQIERFTRVKMQRGKSPTAAEVQEARANVFLDKLRNTLRGGEFKRQDHLIERLLEEGFASTDIASALLHHLQSGEAAPAAQPPREEMLAQTERPRFEGGRREREERPENFRARRDERGRGRKPFDDRKPREFERPPRKPWPPDSSHAPRGASESGPRAATGVPPDMEGAVSPPSPATAPAEPLKEEASPRKAHAARPATKHSRRTPPHMTRLYMNLGREMGVVPADVVQAISGETGLPASVVGTVDTRDRHLFVDVASEHANAIIARLNRTRLKDHKVKLKVA